MGGPQAQVNSVESRGVSRLESMNLRNALSSLWVGHRPMGTHNNLSPRLGLPKYLEIRGSGISNGTEDGTEFDESMRLSVPRPAERRLTDSQSPCNHPK